VYELRVTPLTNRGHVLTPATREEQRQLSVVVSQKSLTSRSPPLYGQSTGHADLLQARERFVSPRLYEKHLAPHNNPTET